LYFAEKEKGEENMRAKLFTISVGAMLLLSMFVAFKPVYAAPRIYLTPSNNIYTTNTATIGTLFNVTVWCENVPDLGGANIYLEFNDDIINVTRWICPHGDPYFFMPEPPPATELPASPDPGYIHVAPGKGYVKIAVSKGGLPPGPPWGHSGKIAIFEFKITALPPKLGELNCTLKIDDENTFLLDPNAVKVPGVIKDNGWYEISWAKPGPARMGVKPKTTHLGPYPPPAVGQTVDIGVYIENLDAAWYLTSASFKLYYNATVADVLGDTANVTWADIWGTTSITFTRNPINQLDYMTISVSNPSTNPGGSPPADQPVCTLKFTVLMQSEVPAVPAGYMDICPLNFTDVSLQDHVGPVDTSPPNNGKIEVEALIVLPMALFKVVDPTDGDNKFELGFVPSVGKEFEADIVIGGPTAAGLHWAWYLIGFQFRLLYDASLLQIVDIREGPFLKDGPWNLYGTFFIGSSEPDTMYGPHAMVGCLLLPNPANGQWDMTTWPNGTGVLAKITFKAIKQECFTAANLTCELGLIPLFPSCWAIDRNGNYIPIDEASNVNGTYIMYRLQQVGRQIDVYGGAVNRGYGVPYGAPSAFPAPYGGQGPNGNMDLVIPQSVVYLLANVTYNFWPVQAKDVGFEIQGPYDQETGQPRYTFFIRKYSNRTDSEGMAWIKFQMPWPCPGQPGPNGEPCERPEDLFGKYKVTATVDICGVVVTDVLWFDYYYLVEITKVTTDKWTYAHCEEVTVTIEFRTKAQQYYPVLFAIVLQDELETHVDAAYDNRTIGGAPFCHWREYTVKNQGAIIKKVHVYKWAFAGVGHIYVSAFDKDPTEGGAPWCPTYGLGWPLGSELPDINILPE
jgi:hypothetical protein